MSDPYARAFADGARLSVPVRDHGFRPFYGLGSAPLSRSADSFVRRASRCSLPFPFSFADFGGI
jgi:hypothetical protein